MKQPNLGYADVKLDFACMQGLSMRLLRSLWLVVNSYGDQFTFRPMGTSDAWLLTGENIAYFKTDVDALVDGSNYPRCKIGWYGHSFFLCRSKCNRLYQVPALSLS